MVQYTLDNGSVMVRGMAKVDKYGKMGRIMKEHGVIIL